jgi:hypothetical protein
MKTLMPLLVSGIVSFILVFGGWMCSFWLKEDSFASLVTMAIWGVPGFLILSIFKGGWAVIHIDWLITLTPVVSFLFWIVVLLAVRKVFLILKKRYLKHKTPAGERDSGAVEKVPLILHDSRHDADV